MRRSTSSRQALMDAGDVVKTLPDGSRRARSTLDMNYWAENRDAIGERWYAWQAK